MAASKKRGVSDGAIASANDSSSDEHSVAPSKQKEDAQPLLTILDFHCDNASNRFTGCPAGHELHRAHYREYEDQHVLLMLGNNQGPGQACSLKTCCPMRYDSMLCDLRVNGEDLRLAQQRAAEGTEGFKDEYRKRGGMEATNAMLKRVTGFGRLRVRGRPAVTMSTLLKVAGWNLMRAASVHPLVEKLNQHSNVA